MELVTGTFGTLHPKLTKLLHGEYKLQKNMRENIEFITKELKTMQATVRNVGEVPLEHLPLIWTRSGPGMLGSYPTTWRMLSTPS
jgi:hypothetical protein